MGWQEGGGGGYIGCMARGGGVHRLYGEGGGGRWDGEGREGWSEMARRERWYGEG